MAPLNSSGGSRSVFGWGGGLTQGLAQGQSFRQPSSLWSGDPPQKCLKFHLAEDEIFNAFFETRNVVSGDGFRRDFTLQNSNLSDIIKYITESS